MVAALGFAALGQYAINWHTIDGGGGTSTGGVYSLTGTIGQPDAGGLMTNGAYAVIGGFWALPTAIQTEGGPILTIIPAGAGQAQVSWSPVTATNWILQQSAGLSPVNWTNSPSGGLNPVIVPATNAGSFYRLKKT